jgi:hypothetical protein
MSASTHGIDFQVLESQPHDDPAIRPYLTHLGPRDLSSCTLKRRMGVRGRRPAEL